MEQSKSFSLVINTCSNNAISFWVKGTCDELSVTYFINDERFLFHSKSPLYSIIKNNEFQLKKVITSALKGKVTKGQIINFVFIDNFPFFNSIDYLQFICVDQRQNSLKIFVKPTPTEAIVKIFSDGSSIRELKQAGYAGIVEYPDGSNEVYANALSDKSSNLTELLAVIAGVKRVEGEERIQINTDSRFVIRGISQWIHFWKLNNWQTAFGTEVKFANYWQQLNKLIQGKYIELKWIKGHSGHLNQTFCHEMAKEIASQAIKAK